MKSFVALSLSAAVLATPMPQASSSAGCASSVDYTFQITTVLPSKKRQADTLVVSLKDGILTDALGRTGYIASNSQFQFDAPVQAGALQQSGFSLCSNGALALGGSTTWYQCLSGDFYNLYSQSTGPQCSQILIQAVEMGNTASQIADGQPQATSAGVSQISDGQPQATSAGVSQISDGQVQASSAQVVTQISDGQVQATAASSAPAVVSQISDGQIQASAATSVAMVSQISDGQIQASAAVSMSKPAAVTQISDGQIQASSAVSASKPAAVTQISDGQIQASSAVSASKPAVVTQISDGQVQASAATSHASVYNATATYTVPAVEFTGAAASGVVPMGALAAGLFGLFAMF